MDKEREIEGIVEAMYAICDDCNDCPYKKYGYFACDEHQKAEHIYEAGYRKIIPNVDFVVRAGELATMREKAYNEGRKETAREILYFLKGRITDGLLRNHEILNALIKQYGVEGG